MAEKQTKTILFICTGNTCRSSMAETLAKEYLRQREKAETSETSLSLRVISAGTGALDNEPASSQAKVVMSERGLDLSAHRAKSLTAEILQEADLILTMTERQKSQLEKMYPVVQDKVYLLKEYALGEDFLMGRKEKAVLLYEEIEKEKRAFFQAHRREIEGLEKQKAELLTRLAQIEQKLNGWEKKLAEAAREKITELRKIEEEIRNQDILDPFGQPVEIYRKCAGEISEYIPKVLEKFLAKLREK